MTSLIRATDYHKNAMNKLISGLIGRCDKTLALASLAALLDRWSAFTLAAYAKSACRIVVVTLRIALNSESNTAKISVFP